MPEDWHSLTIEAAFEKLHSSASGLTGVEAAQRLAKFGPNELVQTTRISPLRIFLEQFADVLVVILIIAAGISAYLGLSKGDSAEIWDAALIFVIVILNAILGFVQEYRAEKSLQALKALAAPRAHVIRDGLSRTVPSQEIVPGDVVVLSAGDRSPADLRLVQVASLRTNESSLTGESTPVGKRAEPVPPSAFLGDRRDMAFMGTSIDGGRGRGLVVATGMATELGKIAGLVQAETKEETPLQRQLDRLGRQIGIAVLAIAAVIFVIGLIEEVDPAAHLELLFLTAVGLAVAAIPEGLPAIVTISLALGLQRMIKRHALIRKLPAVEALGAATVICTDKTGTLTKGEMNVREIRAGGKTFELRGEGFDPSGNVLLGAIPAILADHPALRDTLLSGILCNDASLRKVGERWTVEGDPTEGALIVAGMRAGLDPDIVRAERPRLAEVPFTSERKVMSTLHGPLTQEQLAELLAVQEERRHEPLAWVANKELFVKGAPERVLPRCTHILVDGKRRPLTDADRGEIMLGSQEMAARALRVLGFATRAFPREVPPLREAELEQGLTFLGLAGMMDAPRSDAKEAVTRCKEAGIQVVMITGDHRLTAMAVAREIGILKTGDRAIGGEELERLSDADLLRDIETITVYARVSPEHKMRIVDAWKKKGHVVAMTGDGVNDAPALKRSDLGVAMGMTGTDVAKESADMILTDDNFASIVAAVEEGRGIYENIRKFVAYLLSANAGEVLIMFLATVLLGLNLISRDFLPFLTPVQLLWINLVTDGFPALALGVDPYPKDIMIRPPRNPAEGVLSRDILFMIIVVAVIVTVGTLGIFFLELADGADAIRVQTVTFTTVVFFELFLVFAMRSPRESIFRVGFLTNKKLILAVLASGVLQLLVIYVPLLQTAFRTESLTAVDWLRTVLIALSAFALVEAIKFARRFRSRDVS
jgi:P-type Ca2+ transporter type 2C